MRVPTPTPKSMPALNLLTFRSEDIATSGDMDVVQRAIADATNSSVSAPAIPAPRVFTLSALSSEKWRLRLPISVEVVSQGETVVASAPEFQLWADGEDENAALDALRDEIVLAREDLEAHSHRLGTALQRQLLQLRQCMERAE